MTFSISRATIIARREYLTTIRRKAFVFSMLLTPAILYVTTFFSTRVASDDARKHQHEQKIVAVVDSSGLFEAAPLSFEYKVATDRLFSKVRSAASTVPVVMRRFDSQQAALDSLKKGTVTQVLVVGQDFLAHGTTRRYENDTRVFTSSGDDRHLRTWLMRSMLAASTDSSRIENVLRLDRTMPLYVPDRDGKYELKDDSKELLAFFLPFGIGFLLAMSIMAGGQYLLQGVAEEKETRILESLLCTVSPNELLVGKLFGLGAAGLTLVGVWIALGAGIIGSSAAFLNVSLPPWLVAIGILYFLLGYLFYASIMTGIGAITNNMREAQQYSIAFTMMNFLPMYVLQPILNSPNSGLSLGMSLFPPMAGTVMMMRLSASTLTGAVIPMWQVALSIGLLALSTVLMLRLSSKVFRIGLLLYGKTPNLPEILKILRQA